MDLQPKKKGDHVKGSIQFSLSPPTSGEIEELGVDLPSRLAKNLVQYIAFAFANALVKMKPRDARFLFFLCVYLCIKIYKIFFMYFNLEEIEELGVDLPSRLAKNLVQYIAFAFASALVKMKPRDARFIYIYIYKNMMQYIAFAFANALVKMKPRDARFIYRYTYIFMCI